MFSCLCCTCALSNLVQLQSGYDEITGQFQRFYRCSGFHNHWDGAGANPLRQSDSSSEELDARGWTCKASKSHHHCIAISWWTLSIGSIGSIGFVHVAHAYWLSGWSDCGTLCDRPFQRVLTVDFVGSTELSASQIDPWPFWDEALTAESSYPLVIEHSHGKSLLHGRFEGKIIYEWALSFWLC